MGRLFLAPLAEELLLVKRTDMVVGISALTSVVIPFPPQTTLTNPSYFGVEANPACLPDVDHLNIRILKHVFLFHIIWLIWPYLVHRLCHRSGLFCTPVGGRFPAISLVIRRPFVSLLKTLGSSY
jgi:hypothetical protein